jgi:hypothetical protein
LLSSLYVQQTDLCNSNLKKVGTIHLENVSPGNLELARKSALKQYLQWKSFLVKPPLTVTVLYLPWLPWAMQNKLAHFYSQTTENRWAALWHGQPSLFCLNSDVTSHHLTVVPQSSAKDQFLVLLAT